MGHPVLIRPLKQNTHYIYNTYHINPLTYGKEGGGGTVLPTPSDLW